MRSFNTALAKEPVEIDGEDYALVELPGRARDKYMQGMSGRMRYNAKGMPAGLKNFDGLQATLLTKVLHAATLDKSDPDDIQVVEVGEPVVLAKIQEWGSNMQTELFEMAQEICGMGDDAEADAKND